MVKNSRQFKLKGSRLRSNNNLSLPKLAKDAIKEYLDSNKIIDPPKDIPKEFLKKKAGVFVSLHKKDGTLRGCIGTFEPTKKNIAHEVITNAISAATRDPRFYPITTNELADLVVSVDVLSEAKPCNDQGLNPKKYGVIVSCADGRKGLLLPDIDGIDSVDDQINIACQKANIFPEEDYQIYKFEVKRYQ